MNSIFSRGIIFGGLVSTLGFGLGASHNIFSASSSEGREDFKEIINYQKQLSMLRKLSYEESLVEDMRNKIRKKYDVLWEEYRDKYLVPGTVIEFARKRESKERESREYLRKMGISGLIVAGGVMMKRKR